MELDFVKTIQVGIPIRDFADKLALGNSQEQSKFFNEFFQGLRISCGGEYKASLQLSNVAENITKENYLLMKEFVAHIENELKIKGGEHGEKH